MSVTIANSGNCSTAGISVCKIFQIFFIRRLVVADGRSKHLKDENKSIDGKCHTKQIENTPRRDPHLYGTPGVALQQIVKNGAVHSSPKFLLPDLTLGCPRRGEGVGVRNK